MAKENEEFDLGELTPLPIERKVKDEKKDGGLKQPK